MEPDNKLFREYRSGNQMICDLKIAVHLHFDDAADDTDVYITRNVNWYELAGSGTGKTSVVFKS